MDLDSLPDVIISDILARVSTLDLIRLKCVCKRWKSIVENPYFYQLQSSCSAPNPSDNRALMLQQGKRLFFVGLYDKAGVFKRELTNSIVEYAQVKSHNGLLCYVDDCMSIFITNPFTNQRISLPKFDDMESLYSFDTCGFVFDPTTNFYKVVVLVECDPDLPYMNDFLIFDSGSKMWRSIGEPPYYLINRNLQVLVNERFHWMAGDMAVDKIVSFDLNNETFSVMSLPNDSLEFPQLMAFDGKLCIVDHCQEGQTLQLRIWIMKEYGVEESWANDFNVEHSLPFEVQTEGLMNVVLMGELHKGKILLICDGDTMLFYDLRGQECRFLESRELPLETLERMSQDLPMDTQEKMTASIHIASLSRIPS